MKTQNAVSLLPASIAKSNNEPAVSRRRFMASATITASVMAVPTSAASYAANAAKPTSSSSALLASDFRRHLTSEFHAKSLSNKAAPVISLALTDVSAHKNAHPSLSAEAAAENVFSLKFTVKSNTFDAPTQDTYWVSHATLGEFALLMVPAQGGRALRAEFHRL